MKLIIPLLVALVLCGCIKDNEPENNGATDKFKQGMGVVTFADYAPLAAKPVKVFYHIPVGGDPATMPILFVMHGTGRNAEDYLKAWITEANTRKFMVFAPEFSEQYYSSPDYIEGGMFKSGVLQAENLWTFSIMEALFDRVKADLGNNRTTYDIWGHSAGAQFVHRMVMFKPDARIGLAVSSNAGWYTLPDFTVAYPYGLKNTPATTASLGRAMAKALYIHLGTADTDPNDSSLNHTAGADAQGLYRYARGLYFWDRVQTAKAAYPTCNWTKREVQGVAHDFTKMAADAAKFLY